MMGELEQFIFAGRRGTMIVLVGPSGAGKTELGRKLNSKVCE
jgi:ABC-type phosphate/phosphonate transport system ATPase subunit